MALIVLTSASGAPGVTTLAVGLTLTWGGSVTLVDADPGAHQAVLAGYLRGQVRTDKGLLRVAEAHRDRRSLPEVVSDQTIPLTAEVAAGRRLLPGFARPANAGLFGPVWPDLAEAFAGFERAGIDVIVDAGRLSGSGLPQPLVDRADLIGLLTTTDLRSLAAARGHAGPLREQARLSGGESDVQVLLAGENRPYGQREITKLLGLNVLGVVARHQASAAVFSDGAPRPRRFERSALARSLHQVAGAMGATIDRRRNRLGLPVWHPAAAPGLGTPGDSAPGESPRSPADTAAELSETVPRPDGLGVEPAAGGERR